jgi:serine/threonine protein phosphatase PrpC
VRPRRISRRGVVHARGFFFGRLLPEADVRARVLGMWRPGCAVFRTPAGLAILFREARRVRAEDAPGTPICAERGVLSTCPLEADEIALLAPPDGAIVVVRAGVAHAFPCDAEEDPAAWLDVGAFERVLVTPLGDPPRPPRVTEARPKIDVRAALGAPPAARELEAIRAALGGEKGKGTARPGALSRILGALSSVVSFFAAKPKPRLAGSGGRALAAVPQEPSGPSWLDRVRSRLLDLAARFLVLARLASFIGRQHARYLARMIEMFEKGDYEEALRHAIPMGGEGKGEDTPPALLPMRPRDDLTIHAAHGAARGAIGVGPNLFTDLRAMYRRAFERLVERGDIERAAFVLAELLHANEEAVSFLERHGKYRLAAEIAEARGLPPGLVVRQWFLAGETARAIAFARRHGAFADAVARLERSGEHAELAVALRLHWADLLASSGAYAAAIDVVWPIERARPLARAWMDRAIAVGGASGGRMLARKAALGAEVFAEVRAALGELLADANHEADAARLAFARELALGPASPEPRVLARRAARALVALTAGPRRRSAVGVRAVVDALVHFSADAPLRTDIRPLLATSKTPRIRVAAGAASEVGIRDINEDAWDFGELRFGGRKSRGAALGAGGYVLTVLDGTGGYDAGKTAARIAADVIFEVLCATAREDGPRPRDVLGRDLLLAVKEANRRIYDGAMRDTRLRGMGAAVTCAALVDGVLLVVQAGDTRAYVVRDGAITQVTRDDSLVNMMLLHGKLRPDEVEDFPHKNVITLALGTASEIEPTLTATPLQAGDVVLLASDGMWSMGDEKLLAVLRAENDAQRAANELARAARLAKVEDNATCVVARFEGQDLPPFLYTAPAGLPFEPAPASLADAGEPPLATRTAPRVHERVRADSGSVAIHDAARLPDGRFLVALGEAGVRLVAPDGRTLVHFAQPAHVLVVSDHGDRAIAIANRGEARRLARIDLAGRRVRAWCDALFDVHAPTFDGELFFVARGTRVFGIDATSEAWDAPWSVTAGGRVAALEHGGSELRIVVAAFELWRYELPSFVLRARVPSTAFPDLGAAWRIEREAEGVALRDRGGAERLRVRLEGARRPGARVCASEVIVWDDTGRLLAIELTFGGITRELRLTA